MNEPIFPAFLNREAIEEQTKKDPFDTIIFDTLFVKANSISEYREYGYAAGRTLLPVGRYYFDVHRDSTRWIQMDTEQDAPYYGWWICPDLKCSVAYVEGDISVAFAKDDESYEAMVRNILKWHKENQYWIGADPGLHPTKETTEFLEKLKDVV